MKAVKFFFYLLLLLLPVQLGRHFVFDFSYVSGIRIDYLTPVLYLTDIISFIMVGLYFGKAGKNRDVTLLKHKFLIFIAIFLIFNVIFIASYKWLALYKLVKILQFLAVGYVIVKIGPDKIKTVKILSAGVIYSSIIAVWQFGIQKSIGGIFWLLGERTFLSSTPGIAATTILGKHILRPYSTFPHPNVFGGYLSVILLMIVYCFLYMRRQAGIFFKAFLFIAITCGFTGLILSFSRLAWSVFLVGILLIIANRKITIVKFLKKQNAKILILYYLLIIFSVAVFSLLPFYGQSFTERKNLINTAIEIVSLKPLFGVGLNNYIIQAKEHLVYISELYFLQPVHNIFLLLAAETGIAGLIISLLLLWKVFLVSLKKEALYTIILVQLFFLGLFDHYLFTLQQGMLLFTVFISLVLADRKNLPIKKL